MRGRRRRQAYGDAGVAAEVRGMSGGRAVRPPFPPRGQCFISTASENFCGSFRGACAAREPGIHTPSAVVMGSGFAASRRPGTTKNFYDAVVLFPFPSIRFLFIRIRSCVKGVHEFTAHEPFLRDIKIALNFAPASRQEPPVKFRRNSSVSLPVDQQALLVTIRKLLYKIVRSRRNLLRDRTISRDIRI